MNLFKVLPFKYFIISFILFHPQFSYSQNAEQILRDAIKNTPYISIEYSFNEEYYNSIFNETDTVSRRGFVYQEINAINLRFGLNYLVHVISKENKNDAFYKEHLFLNDTMFNFYSDVSIFNYIIKSSKAYNYNIKDKESYTKISPMLIKYFYQDLLNVDKQKKWDLKIDFSLKSDTIINRFDCYQIKIITENGYLVGYNIFDLNDIVKSENVIILRKIDLVPVKVVFKSSIENSYTSEAIEMLQLEFSNIIKNGEINFSESPVFMKSKANSINEYRIYLEETYGLKSKEFRVL